MRKTKIFIPILLISLGTILFLGTPLRRWAVAVWTRSPVCSLKDALKAYGQRSEQNKALNRIQATSRLLQRDPAGLELWETSRGSFWIPAGNSLPLFRFLALQQLHSYGSGETGMRAGDIVLDCGAHVGTYTREALASGAKLVVAIEPVPENLACLRRTFSKEISAGHVLVYPKGIWDRDDYLVMKRHGTSSGTYAVTTASDDSPDALRIPLTTIDKLVGELNLQRVDFIKMHVEGAEPRALLGAQKTLARYKPRLAIAVYHHRDDPEKIALLVLKEWPAYKMQCGPCWSKLGIHPMVLSFQ
jgi:FkbM family methyltransferase